jgi:iron complex transport system ATP-binding protein
MAGAVSPAAREAALRLDGVTLRAGGRALLDAVSLELHPGELLTLLGPNGAGKTSLLRVASRVRHPDAGAVWLEGRPLAQLSARTLARRLAVVPQDVSIAFPFTAGEVVLMGRAPHGGRLGFETAQDLALARGALEKLGIAGLADRSVLELSGGERQLVLVARALAQAPAVLLLDEPTAHLDLRHRVAVLEQVRRFVDAGGSALVVSHDLGLAADCADRVALLRDGCLRAAGAPREVLTPGALRDVFDVEVQVVSAPDGSLAVLPRRPARDG